MHNVAAEALDQVRKGKDFTAPAKLLRGLAGEKACQRLPGWPYSIAENVAHAEYWQRLWLARLKGEKRPKMDRATWDWPKVSPEEWSEVRSAWLQGLDEAYEIATRKPFQHAMKSDEIANQTLMQIAVHNAYHVGQVKLLKRLMRVPGADRDD